MDKTTFNKQHYINQIKNLPETQYNTSQKNIAIKAIQNADEDIVEQLYLLLSARISTGFVFDKAPETNQDAISYLVENKKRAINPIDTFDKNGLTDNNMLIVGDNYDALKNLLLTHKGLVDVIYIDPPYNTDASINEKNNLSESEVETRNSTRLTYRDKFSRTGWLNMMQERLMMGKQLLKDDGVIFVSIDDNEQAYLKVLMDKIFGEENFISTFKWVRNLGGKSDSKFIAETTEFILIYTKNIDNFKIKTQTKEKDILDFKFNEKLNLYCKKSTMLEKGGSNDLLVNRPNLGYVLYFNEKENKLICKHDYDKTKINHQLTDKEEIYYFDKELIDKGYIAVIPRKIKGTYGCWRVGNNRAIEMFEQNRLMFEKDKNGNWRVYEREIYSPNVEIKPKDFITFASNSEGTNELKKVFGDKCPFSNPKPVSLIKYLIDLHPNPNAVILDFFAGSGTTGQAVMELNQEDNGNRKFILCTNNQKINNTDKFIAYDVTYERLFRVINGKGYNGESFDWKYSTDTPYLTNNSLKVYDIRICDISLKSTQLDSILPTIEPTLKNINNKIVINNEFDVVKKLYALKPYQKPTVEEIEFLDREFGKNKYEI